MWVVTIVVCGAVAVWLLFDRYIGWREHKTASGRGAWSSQFGGANRAFHSTGFEDTMPPALTEAPRAVAR